MGLLSRYATDPSPEGTAFRQGLRERGWAKAGNIVIERRFATSAESLRVGVRELLDRGVEVVVAIGNDATRTAREATQTVPIVALLSTDPLGEGFVASLARPGGNVTGLTNLGAGLSAKRLELFKTATPNLSHVAVLWPAGTDEFRPDLAELGTAAQTLGVRVVDMPSKYGGFLNHAFELITRSGANGVVVLTDQSASPTDMHNIANLAIEHRLPTTSGTRTFAEQGGLLAYGPNPVDLYRRGAYFVDRILRGAMPGDLPVEQPNTFDLVVNLRTAGALGLTIPDLCWTRRPS